MAKGQGVRAGKAFVEVGLKANLQNGIKQIQRQMAGISKSLGTFGAGLGTAGATITAPLIAAAKVFSDTGDALDKMAGRTGASVEWLSGMGFAAQQSGSSIGVVEGSIRRMQQAVAEAAGGTTTYVDALAAAGASADELAGMSPEQQFDKIADGLAGIQDPGARAAAAMEIFGRSGTQLLPMLAGGSAGMAELRAEAERLGIVMSTEDATAAAALTDAMGRIKSTLTGLTQQIGAAVAPALTWMADTFAAVSTAAISFIRDNRELIVIAGSIGAAALSAGGFFLGLAGAFKVISIAAGAVGTVITTVGAIIGAVSVKFLLPVIAIAAGIGVAIYAASKWTTAFGDAWEYVSGVAQTAIASMKELFGSIRDALSAGNYRQALQILWAGIKVAFWEGTAEIVRLYSTTWERASKYTTEFFRHLLDTAWKAFTSIPKMLKAALSGGESLAKILADAMAGEGEFGLSGAIENQAKAARAEYDRLRHDAAIAADTAAQARAVSSRSKEGDDASVDADDLEARAATAKQAADAAAGRVASLQDEIRTLQMGADAAERYKLAQQGATEEQLAAVESLQNMRRELKEREEANQRRKQETESLEAEGRQLAESLRTPLEILAAEKQRIDRLFRSGAIDASTANRALGAARERYAEDTAAGAAGPTSDTGSNTVAMRGTQAALDTLRRNAGGDGASQLAPENRWVAPLVENARAQLAASRQMPERLAGLMARQQRELINTRELERIGNRQLNATSSLVQVASRIETNTKPQPQVQI